MLIITHTHEAGTIIEGTSRGDGTAEILKQERWRWGRSIGAWFVPMSRDRRPKHLQIRATVAALEAAGHQVMQELDESVRSTAEVEAGKIARQEARTAALEAKADRKEAAADAAWQRHERDVAVLPEGGEPIKIGHHSESRHRNDIARAHNSIRRSVDAQADAEQAAESARIASRTTGARYSVVTVANRIEKIAATIRRADRRITESVYDVDGGGYRPSTAAEQQARAARLAPRIAELRDELAYWEGVRDEQIASGQHTGHSAATIAKGDAVKVRGHWHRVARVNAKSVSVETEYSWTDRTPYAEIQEHRPAGDPAPVAE